MGAKTVSICVKFQSIPISLEMSPKKSDNAAEMSPNSAIYPLLTQSAISP
jgi:hypothetical protein